MKAGSIDPKQKRLGEIKDWFDAFTVAVKYLQATGRLKVSHADPGNFWFPSGAAENVNNLYWAWMEDLVRPMVGARNGNPETNIDRHKICSLLELSVIAVQPVECDKPSQVKGLNARLAYHVAISFIANWLEIPTGRIFPYVSTAVAENHLTWLRNFDDDGIMVPPIFSNAVTWQLIEENFQIREMLAKNPPPGLKRAPV